MHRFVVSASVEENVHALAQRRASAMDLSLGPAARKGEQQSLTVRFEPTPKLFCIAPLSG